VHVWPVFSMEDAGESVRRGVPTTFSAVYMSAQALAAWLREQWARLSQGEAYASLGSLTSHGTGTDASGASPRLWAGKGKPDGSPPRRNRRQNPGDAFSTPGPGPEEDDNGSFAMQSPMLAAFRTGRRMDSPSVAKPPLDMDFASPQFTSPVSQAGKNGRATSGQMHAAANPYANLGRTSLTGHVSGDEKHSQCPSLVASALVRLLLTEGVEEASAQAVQEAARDILLGNSPASGAGNK